MDEQTPDIKQQVAVMQIIAGALMMGVVMFAGIVVVIGGLNQPSTGIFMGLMGAGFAVMAMVLHIVVPNAMARQGLADMSSNSAASEFVSVYQGKLIVGLALLEGAAFFNLICCIIEHNWWSMAIAGALLSWMLFAFPTRSRVEHWIENKRFILEHRQRM